MKALRVAGLLVVTLFVATGLRWAVDNFEGASPPAPSPADPSLSFAATAHLARAAVRELDELPPHERRQLGRALRASLMGLERWKARINAGGPELLCIGERHQDAMRWFLARELLPGLEFDVLMLEAGNDQVNGMLAARDSRHRLLGAVIDPIIDEVLRRRPAPWVVPIDESPVQRKARLALVRAALSWRVREDTIVQNLRRRWHPGRRHVVLFGALHCRDLPGWFYRRLHLEDPRVAADRVHNVVLLARHLDPGAEILYYLLDALDLAAPVLVIPETARLPDRVRAWLPPLADALATYRSAIIFDDRALAATLNLGLDGH